MALISGCLNVPAHELDMHAPLTRYGLDSLASVELTAAIATVVGRDLPDSFIFDYPTIASLARFLRTGESPVRRNSLAQMHRDAALPRELRPEGECLRDPPRTILLTGATGFLGAYLLRVLLRETEARVYCLVRAHRETEGLTRIRSALEKYQLWDRAFERRVEAVAGDLTSPGLGLAVDTREALARKIEAIYHCAAAVNWVLPYAALRAVNVTGTLELLRFACSGRSKPFHFISTLGVCYSMTGPGEAREEEDPLPYLGGIHLGYAQSKCVAEALVRCAGERGLPVTIYRPSLITGDTLSGASAPDDLLATFLKGCIAMGCAPDLDWTMDCCPVDYVSEAIVRLSHRSCTSPRVFHLANPQPRHWRECVLWMNLIGYEVRLLPHRAWLRRMAIESRAPGHPLAELRAFFLKRLGGADGLTLPELYQDGHRRRARAERTQQALDELALRCPPLTSHLLERYFAWFVARGVLPPALRRRAALPSRGSWPMGPHVFTVALQRFYKDRTLQVTDAGVVGIVGAETSLVTELAAPNGGGPVGLFRYRLTLAARRAATPSTLDVIVKCKPKDETVIEVGRKLAHLCGAALGRVYARFTSEIGLAGCHIRELEVYRQADPRFRRYTPAVYTQLRDDADGRWILVLEDLDGLAMKDTAADGASWQPEQVGVVLRGLADLHAIWYGREADLARQPWVAVAPSYRRAVAMAPLWRALADHAGPRFAAWVEPGIRRLQRNLVVGLESWWQPLEQLPRTLIHNDFNPRNLALRMTSDGWRLCAWDWELATSGIPQHDLAEFLCFALTPPLDAGEVHHYLEFHRASLEQAVGRPVDPMGWVMGFRLALADLLLNRLAWYAVVDTVRRQRFLPRVVQTWAALHELFPVIRQAGVAGR